MYRLLIVDDKQDICENIKYLLDWFHYGFSSIMTANSYSDAVSKSIDLQPHIALVDMRLGEHWGYELVAHLRSIGMKTVFCMMSGSEDLYHIKKTMQAGAQDLLLKPINCSELQTFVERVIANEFHHTLPETAAQQQQTDPVLHVEYAKLSRITNKIILLVKSNYHHSLSLLQIAESFNMNSKYIGRIFLQDTGMKFSEYLTAYRMEEARRLVINTQEKISVIAAMVGYSQLNNFYTQFRNYFGFSPSSLRQFDPVNDPASQPSEVI